jgi:cysteine-S-conjugate beta-lyase
LALADEIHADLTLPGHQHTSFSTVSEAAFNNSITFIAPSKTFNMAGLASSLCYVPNPEIRKQFFGFLDANELSLGSLFAYIAADAAFTHGEEWLRQLLDYLQHNIDFAEQYLERNIPEIKMMKPEASFLLWLDFRNLHLNQKELVDLLVYDAKVGLNNGVDYGPEGEGFMRMNVGTPLSVVNEALDRIAESVKRLRQ